MKCNTIIFDLDGTLLNTLEDLMDSVNYALSQYGMPKRELEEIRHFVGNGVERLMELSVPDGKNNPVFQEAFACFKEHYLIHCNDKTGPYPHIMELLEALHDKGYNMAIVSNKYMNAVKELNELYFSRFIKVAIGESAGIRKKPAPDTVEEAIRQLGVSKDSCVYVGDSEVDHMTAVNSGLRCISCLWGFRTKEELIKAGAGNNIFVTDPMQILEVIQEEEL
ncbi:hydrolase HAD superfamily [Butyrivibrio proteoclasticus B316]|uniref:Hydrolase HAD superfamily n=1 Tax=Butyrivibrio proteoclasticus (strain ATCC 51982 / DSM 14932 / B316) TaxID=515622 RepID=E0RYN9_BUTPB|nr:HAD-IIIA family hydrolase [Butyrivibrio proteoclasticus]ADL34734.1 hydrolase HAD superfamily [Butyrivibrio proteoclasticus B316]